MKHKIKKILFICVANSARSQIAEAISKIVLPDYIEVMSAGSIPASEVNPYAVKVLKEYGVDSSILKPKSIKSLPLRYIDESCLVIRLCSEEQCPLIGHKANILDWSMPDPASTEDKEKAFEETAALIVTRLKDLREML